MKHLFSLNAEGGPLLCLDARTATRWKGSEGGSIDYKNLCATVDVASDFSASVIPIAGKPSIVWEMNGPGTADVFLSSCGVVRIVRAWLARDTAEELAKLAEGEPILRQQIGEIDIPSGILGILWAPESGKEVPQQLDSIFKAVPGTAIDNSVFVVKIASGRYLCYDELIENGASQARRLSLIPHSQLE